MDNRKEVKIMAEYKRLDGIPATRQDIKWRKEHVKSMIIHYPQYNETLELLEDIIYHAEGSVNPDQLFIYGPTGVGKSTVTREFTDRYPIEQVNDAQKKYKRIPVLHMKVPPKATPKSLASKILHKIGDPFYSQGTEIQLTSRIHHFIEELEIKMIILDEFQHLIDSDTEHVLATAANWVKTFSEESGIPIVLCGMPSSIHIFEKEEQLDRRYASKLAIEPFHYTTPEEQLLFRAFLNKIESGLPFPDRSHLSDVRIADKLYYISLGVPFYIMKLLELGTEIALKDGEDKITEVHFQEALSRLKQVSRPFRTNPFNTKQFNLEEELSQEKKRWVNEHESVEGKRKRRK